MSNNKDIKPTDSRKSRGKTKPGVIMPASDTLAAMPEGYLALLIGLKERIGHERIKAVISANAAMVLLYWDIGQSILERQHQAGWGTKVIDRLSHDLKTAFPDMTGFSPRNLKYMRTFAQAWPDRAIVQRTVAQLPWRSNLTLLDKLSDPETRLWYAQKALELGMGKDMLVFFLFPRAAWEYRHSALRCVPLARTFRIPTRRVGTRAKDKNQTVVEYSLAGNTKPIGVAQWERYITQSLPDYLKASLPSVEEIEVELSGDSND